MVELGPVVSFFKLFIDGIKLLKDKINDSKKSAVLSELKEMKLLLEKIIDTAQKLLSLAENKYDMKSIDELKQLLHYQKENIWHLLDLYHSKPIQETLMMFTPSIGRRINELLRMKKDAIYLYISKLGRLDKDLLNYPYAASFAWNHNKFVDFGEEYVHELFHNSMQEHANVLDVLKQQKSCILDLISCSNELSGFFANQLSIQDVI
jgi:hypothetical protein